MKTKQKINKKKYTITFEGDKKDLISFKEVFSNLKEAKKEFEALRERYSWKTDYNQQFMLWSENKNIGIMSWDKIIYFE